MGKSGADEHLMHNSAGAGPLCINTLVWTADSTFKAVRVWRREAVEVRDINCGHLLEDPVTTEGPQLSFYKWKLIKDWERQTDCAFPTGPQR